MSPVVDERETGRSPEGPHFRPADWLRIAGACTAVVVIAVVCALVIGARGPDVYGGRADILYVAPDAPLDVRQRSLATQVELARSRAVLESAAEQAGVPLDRLEDELSVDTSDQDDLLHITVSDEDRAVARRHAQAVAASYLQLAERVQGGAGEASVRLLSPAYALDSPLSPKPLRAAAVGLLIGLGLATGLAVLLVRERRRPGRR